MTCDVDTDPRVLRSRAAVLAAALALIGEQGIAATTIEAVARRSRVAKTTIYRQWDSQQAMVLAAFSSLVQAPPDPDTGTLRGDLLELVRGLARALTSSPAALLMPALIDAAERDPAFAALHRREADRRHEVVVSALDRGIARGELPAGTDPGLVLDLITGPLFYRRYVSCGAVDEEFAQLVVSRVLAAFTRD